MADNKPMTPSEMGKKSRQNLRDTLSQEELSAYYRRIRLASVGKKKKQNSSK